jgi:hypothetical protein
LTDPTHAKNDSTHPGTVESSARRGFTIIHLIAACLGLLCLSLALLIGNIGFQGDDWWQFSWPHWHDFPYSIWEYAKASSRPVEGFYTVLTFELFGLNRVFYTLTALLLSGGACLLMGSCLRRAFPGKDSLVVLSVAFAFLIPTASNLIYMFHTDNSRISALFFWVSAWSFQRWAAGQKPWSGLIVPSLLYLLAAFTYENTTFLIFAVPLLVWPVHVLNRNNVDDRTFLMRIVAGVATCFAFFVLARFAVFSGGAVGHRSLIPSATLIWSYMSNLMWYLVTPFRLQTIDSMSLMWGLAAALMIALLLFLAVRNEQDTRNTGQAFEQSSFYLVILGFAILALGILPYLMAGYDSSPGFTSQSRIYSSGSFGLAILLATALTGSASSWMLSIKKAVAVVMIAFMAFFLAGLRNDWLKAADMRDRIAASLLRQVPNVTPGTTFLFVDLQSYIIENDIGKAVVFQGVDGIGEFVRMLYKKQNLHAYFVYPDETNITNSEDREASVSQKGLVTRGSGDRPPIPLNTLLILKREGNNMVLVDKLSSDEKDAAIQWNGLTEIHSNRDLILQSSVETEEYSKN